MADRLLRIQEVSNRLGVCESTVYLWIRKGIFPAPTHIGGRTAVWRESTLIGWLDEHVPLTDEVQEG